MEGALEERLHLCNKRNQLTWFKHPIRMSPGCLPLVVFWTQFVEGIVYPILPGNGLGFPPEGAKKVSAKPSIVNESDATMPKDHSLYFAKKTHYKFHLYHGYWEVHNSVNHIQVSVKH